MRKWLEIFKNLPPETRTLVALAGFGTFAAVAYGAAKLIGDLMPPGPLHGTTGGFLVLLLLVILLTAISAAVRHLAGRRSRRRSQQMANELSGDLDRGPVSLDLRAIVKANNEKFAAAVRDMRKNAGLNVYDLPWYIVIGDSGCGKTKLINESGLTFSLGKPEGYQLGTLNYNWWFTEDAIFIDMAGKLCNPQDDADRKEWTAFLDTVGRGRPGFPINGAICCVSAEHLLQDPPEKIEQDANTMLERLRDLQSKLGVTFATYLVITKCDKILGFMQFFDRADRDITVKNQIVGWSRPGAFNELYDPDNFAADFEALYGRLNDLRIRRLNDDADEAELGLAYAYPEQFRELCAPLETYLRTLFPPIKNPRAAKNLVFRGIYFTSATQQGGVILKHLMERLGPAAAEHFPPLESLYPRPRPMFVKDLMVRKVFPEQGLVFRNEAQVIRNRKLSRLLRVGGVTLGGFLILIVGSGLYSFSSLIGKPRDDAMHARLTATRADAMKLIADLDKDIKTLEGTRGLRRLLHALAAPTASRKKPIQDLRVIQAGLFQQVVLPEVFEQVQKNLVKAQTAPPPRGPADDPPLGGFKDALVEYVRWYAWADGPEFLEAASSAREFADTVQRSFDRLLAFCEQPDSRGTSADSARNYFRALNELGAVGRAQWPNPAASLKLAGLLNSATIDQALARFEEALGPWAALNVNHPDAEIRNWMAVHQACKSLKSSYESLLALNVDKVVHLDSLRTFKAREFDPPYARFKAAMDELAGPIPSTPFPAALERMRTAAWGRFEQDLRSALAVNRAGSEEEKANIGRLITMRCLGAQKDPKSPPGGLDAALGRSLLDERLMDPGKGTVLAYSEYRDHIQPVWSGHSWIVGPSAPTSQGRADGPQTTRVELTSDAREVAARLREIHDDIQGLSQPGVLLERPAEEWAKLLAEHFQANPAGQDDGKAPARPWPAEWQQEKLADLSGRLLEKIHQGKGAVLLQSFESTMQAVKDLKWGFGRLLPKGRNEWVESAPFQSDPDMALADGGTRAAEPSAPRAPAPSGRRPRRRGAGVRTEPAPPPVQREPATPLGESRKGVLVYMTREHLNAVTRLAADLRMYLGNLDYVDDSEPDGLDETDYFDQAEGAGLGLRQRCLDALEEAYKRYAADYFSQWRRAYEAGEIRSLQDPRKASSWEDLRRRLDNLAINAVRNELRSSLGFLLEQVRYATVDDQLKDWTEKSAKSDERKSWGAFKSIVETQRSEHFRKPAGSPYAFAGERPNPPSSLGRKPWELEADKLAGEWGRLADAVSAGESHDGGRAAPPDKPLPALEWQAFPKLRSDLLLNDERITDSVLLMEDVAMDLLSTELTRLLMTIQRARLGEAADPAALLPYAAGREAITTAGVEFQSFKNLLSDVEAERRRQADRHAELSRNTHGGEVLGYATRDAFLASCGDWARFLAIGHEGKPAILQIKINYVKDLFSDETPRNIRAEAEGRMKAALAAGADRNKMEPQHYYNKCCLEIGLLRSGDAAAAPPLAAGDCPVPIPVFSIREDFLQRDWDWLAAAGQQQARVRLYERQQDRSEVPAEIPLSLDTAGTPSELLFCAYLQQWGNPENRERTKWVVIHEFVVPPQPGKPLPGPFLFAIRFDLGSRSLPAPFGRLQVVDRKSSVRSAVR